MVDCQQVTASISCNMSTRCLTLKAKMCTLPKIGECIKHNKPCTYRDLSSASCQETSQTSWTWHHRPTVQVAPWTPELQRHFSQQMCFQWQWKWEICTEIETNGNQMHYHTALYNGKCKLCTVSDMQHGGKFSPTACCLTTITEQRHITVKVDLQQ